MHGQEVGQLREKVQVRPGSKGSKSSESQSSKGSIFCTLNLGKGALGGSSSSRGHGTNYEILTGEYCSSVGSTLSSGSGWV